jgi:hypothetical protein
MTEPSGPGRTWKDWIPDWIAPSAGDTSSLLAASTGLMAIAAVYLYFTGYVFSLFYFRAFGVSVDSLDLSSQYYLVEAFWVFRRWLGWLVFSAIIAIVYGFATGHIRREILLATLIAAFPALFFTSYYIARLDATYERTNPESAIHLQFKEPRNAAAAPTAIVPTTPAPDAPQPVPTTPEALHQFNQSDPPDLHMLIETKDRIIVFNQPPNVLKTKDLPTVYVYTFLRSDIDWSVNSAN